MKHLLFCCVLALLALLALPGAAQYVSSEPEDVPINAPNPYRWASNEHTRSVFDVTEINNDGWLDLATGQNLENGTLWRNSGRANLP